MPDDVVITGLGVVSPVGCNEEAFWDALYQGRAGASPVTCLDTANLSRKIACQINEPIDIEGVSRPIGRASALSILAARQALANAGLTGSDLQSCRTDISVGTTMGETEFIEERLDDVDENWLTEEHARRIASGKPGSIARNIQTTLGAGGLAMDLYGACAAGNMAVIAARRALLAGQCDVAIAGGADGFSRLAFIGFMRLRVMAAGLCRPFDQQRDGLWVGEGATFFILERESSARARGAKIRASVIGGGMTCENYHPTRPEPNGDGLTRAAEQAIREAGVSPDVIDYVCAHGTGTPHNDAIEVKVLEHCFPRGVSFSSIKALTGHTMGAASAMEAACCVLSLEKQILIPTWHLQDVLEPCSLDALRGAPRAQKVSYVLNNSAGFGGYNSSIILAAA